MKRQFLIAFLPVVFAMTNLFGQSSSIAEKYLNEASKQIVFEENKGQLQSDIQYFTRIGDLQVAYTDQGVTYAGIYSTYHNNERELRAKVWTRKFLNSNSTSPKGKDAVPGKWNFIKEKGTSVAGVSKFSELWYENIYDGIDLRYYASAEGELEYDFIVDKGQNASNIAVQIEGVDQLSITESGELEVTSSFGTHTESKPIAYQFINGKRKEVQTSYILLGKNTYGFKIESNVNSRYALIIDPITFNWGTFVSYAAPGFDLSSFQYASTEYFNGVNAVDVDEMGNVYFVCAKNDSYLPTPLVAGDYLIPGSIAVGTVPGSYNPNIFLYKLDPTGSNLIYVTEIGGGSSDVPLALKIAQNQEAVITGVTESTRVATSACSGNDLPLASSGDFPTTAGAYAESSCYAFTAFVSRVTSTGDNFVYSTLYDNGVPEACYDCTFIANTLDLDQSGRAVIAGYADNEPISVYPFFSNQFPIGSVPPFDPTFDGVSAEGFVARFSADGSSLELSSFIGGTNTDEVTDLAVAQNWTNDIFLIGITKSDDLTTTVSGDGATYGGNGDYFVASIDGLSLGVNYLSYIGTAAQDGFYNYASGIPDEQLGGAIAVTSSNEAFITGTTRATWLSQWNTVSPGIIYPTSSIPRVSSGGLPGFPQEGIPDAFVARLDVNGNPIYSRLLSFDDPVNGIHLAGGIDIARDIEVYNNNAIIYGETTSYDPALSDFDFITTSGALSSVLEGAEDLFVLAINENGEFVESSTFIPIATKTGGEPEIFEENATPGNLVINDCNIYLGAQVMGTGCAPGSTVPIPITTAGAFQELVPCNGPGDPTSQNPWIGSLSLDFLKDPETLCEANVTAPPAPIMPPAIVLLGDIPVGPAGCTSTWVSSPAAIVDNFGTEIGTEPNQIEITIPANAPSGCYPITLFVECECETCSKTVTLEVRQCDPGSKVLDMNPSVSVFPNPTSDYINYNPGIHFSSRVQFEIVDISGRVMANIDKAIEGPFSFVIDVSNYPSGQYIINLSSPEFTDTQRFIVE